MQHPTQTQGSQQPDRPARYTCSTCRWHGCAVNLAPIQRIEDRVAPGEFYPQGQCPVCGALIACKDADIPEHVIVQAERILKHRGRSVTLPNPKARIFAFGTAPFAKEAGYSVLEKLVYGTDQEVLDRYGHDDVVLVRGAVVRGPQSANEFALFRKPQPACALRRLLFVDLDRVEGERAFWRATTFAGANRVLREWSQSAPANGGCDKVTVRVSWGPGFEHTYVFDLKHPSVSDEPNVAADVRHNLSFALGEVRMPEWTELQYQTVMARYAKQGLTGHALQLRTSCRIDDLDPPFVRPNQDMVPPA